MEIKFYGGNCLKVISKKATLVIDDNVNASGKLIATDKDIVLYSSSVADSAKSHFLISGPGEYEVSEVSISGIPSRSHMDEENKHSNTIYKVVIEDTKVGFIGHAHPDLSESQLEAIGTVDILVIPVGGNGYTLDGIGAQKIIKEIEPKVVIPTHYDDGLTKYEVPQAPLQDALKAITAEIPDTLESYKIKNSDSFGEGTAIVVLEVKK